MIPTAVKVKNKPIEIYATCGVSGAYQPDVILRLFNHILPIFREYGFDFYTFTKKDVTTTNLRATGYNLFVQEQESPDETGKEIEINIPINDERIWVKVDDYGDKYVATMLYPNEY